MAYGTLTHSGAAFQPLRALCCSARARVPALAPPARNPTCATPGSLARRWFRRIPFRSPLLRDLFCFLGVHEMFQFPHLPPTQGGSGPMTARGLPHSETRGSTPDCGSPGVSLLVCVLHRLVVPRHPPTARASSSSLPVEHYSTRIALLSNADHTLGSGN
jgi:hypothetical protein